MYNSVHKPADAIPMQHLGKDCPSVVTAMFGLIQCLRFDGFVIRIEVEESYLHHTTIVPRLRPRMITSLGSTGPGARRNDLRPPFSASTPVIFD